MRASPKHWRLVAASRRRTSRDASWVFRRPDYWPPVIGGTLGALMSGGACRWQDRRHQARAARRNMSRTVGAGWVVVAPTNSRFSAYSASWHWRRDGPKKIDEALAEVKAARDCADINYAMLRDGAGFAQSHLILNPLVSDAFPRRCHGPALARHRLKTNTRKRKSPNMLNRCGRAVPPVSYAPQRTADTNGGGRPSLRAH